MSRPLAVAAVVVVAGLSAPALAHYDAGHGATLDTAGEDGAHGTVAPWHERGRHEFTHSNHSHSNHSHSNHSHPNHSHPKATRSNSGVREPSGDLDRVQGRPSTVSVTGTGTVTADPDEAVLRLAATERADNASRATAALAERVAGLRGALAEAGVDRESVRTTEFQVFRDRREESTTFLARQGFSVTVDDPEDVGRVIDRAIAGGATDVFGVEFALSPDRSERLRERALARAVADARATATVLATETDLRLERVLSVSTAGDRFPGPVERTVLDAGTDVDVSPIVVSATVEVTYGARADQS
jgi:uncharacterized protein YggE